MRPELAATAPAIPVWRYRLVAGAAELGGSVADLGACNNAVRGAALPFCAAFPRAREGSASVSCFDPASAPALARARAAPRPAVSIRPRRRGAMGTVRREPIETAGRGVGRSR